jgi:plasmid maintenance system killer protein
MKDNPRSKWTITVHRMVEGKLIAQKLHHPREFEAVCNTMDMLAAEDDPRRPRNPKLNVVPIKYDAPGWYRVRVNPVNWRVVFRILEKCGGRIIEVHDADDLHQEHQGRAIQMTDASHRSRAYGAKLKALWRKAS